ncbi:ATP-binding protein [Amphritea sp. 1_MG-2023]|uniref:ATP-binding protein n=1 Tax=Amphritea sp. 1_MG-2023 TaxID=3062670 RepID=UPI0026E3ECC5|nr:ATP-binding protein [Amphritea sp. 1_MG-2023]MDO6563910.1 ATP-binding protein [Amphritea sp. 1_MG-2023]
MNFNLTELIVIAITYLTILFGTAYITERGWISKRIIYHPITYILSLGVFSSVWTFYGTFALAKESGYSFLASYLGASAAFFLAPVILVPILRITRTYQLSSLADLFAFRFRSATAGTLTAIFSLIAILPLISIQIQAVSDSLHILNQDFSSNQIAIGFCSLIALFTILVGARNPSLRYNRTGLIVAMATGSLIKLFAMVTLALTALLTVMDGPDGLERWLLQHPEEMALLHTPLDSDMWRTMLLGFFSAVIVMPHTFHMMFTENTSSNSLYKASWGLPLYLLIMALSVPPILWAGIKLGIADQPAFLILNLGIQLESNFLTTLAFIGGLTAASGIIIVATISIASMLQNHLILPFTPPLASHRLYSRLLWLRRILIVVMMLCSYLFYSTVGLNYNLHWLGTLAFISFMQFLPGILATLFWPAANRNGFSLGLIAGMGIWITSMLTGLLGGDSLTSETVILDYDNWHQIAIYALSANIIVFLLTSLLTHSSQEEIASASACLHNSLQRPVGPQLNINHSDELTELLSPRLGKTTARREVEHALKELNMMSGELNAIERARLRNHIESRLSALFGPVEASTLLNQQVHTDVGQYRTRDIHLLETQLETYQTRLSGLAAELDNLRRHHRMTLQRLPVGACSLDEKGQIIFWNEEMERFIGLKHSAVLSRKLINLPDPWGELLHNFSQQENNHLLSQHLLIAGENCWLSLHKANLTDDTESMVILLENETENQLLVNRLTHNERLASIGRFAAGVAHEIGNPVTGIACLAQNLKYETDDPYILESAEQIVTQTQRITRIVQSLVRFAHSGQSDRQPQTESINLKALTDEALHLVSMDNRSETLSLINRIESAIHIQGDPQRLMQVFVNLINNACDASPHQGHIWLNATHSGHSVIITINDEGSGISPEHQSKLFEPFFTTKDPGKGTGLGLSLVYNIIEEHYGSIHIVSPANKNQNNGTQVVITLPVS